MTTHQQIVKAIGAHGMWKARLQQAIDHGASDASVTAVRQDNQCDFGKWLYSVDLSADAKRSPHYQNCRHLHRQFHLAASKVLTLALANKKEEATRAMGSTGEFATSSAALTKAMMDWEKEAPH
jgi:methionyl-tRNA formyltransferase